MDSYYHNIFRSKLFLFLSNDNQYDEPETNNNEETGVSDNFFCSVIYPIINSLLDENDLMKGDKCCNKNITNNYTKKKFYFTNKNRRKINFKKGDWLCQFCSNINFSFRKRCNRCGIDK